VDFRNGTRRKDVSRPSSPGSATSALQNLAVLASQGRYARRGVPIGNDTIRVLLVDDHAILRDGVRALLRSAPDIEVVGEAANGTDAVAAAQRSAPDVVVMDLDMPNGDGAAATVELLRLEPAPQVLILTMHTEEERLVPLLKSGARGFLSKDCAERDLVEAIRVVAGGEFYVRPAVARILAANAMPRQHQSSVEEERKKLQLLSARERSVLQGVAEGYSGVEIARMLDITSKTVDTYKNRIGQKLGFTHRTDYVRFALRLGLIGDASSQQNTDADSHLRRQQGL
jgi:two-component system, NarL family, response regulator NreC